MTIVRSRLGYDAKLILYLRLLAQILQSIFIEAIADASTMHDEDIDLVICCMVCIVWEHSASASLDHVMIKIISDIVLDHLTEYIYTISITVETVYDYEFMTAIINPIDSNAFIG